ncbi:hypothetical protein [Ascidiimonas sp. W6]|uniref:hypothetical protein n=1 Tax=Ascidiimonas meishanensis TaxID=3128903 RepID=UPI0030EE1CAA
MQTFKKIVLLFLVLFPFLSFTQKNINQQLAKEVYTSTITSADAGTEKKRNALVKMLNGMLSIADEGDFKDRILDHKIYLDNLEYIKIPTADLTKITDSLVGAYNLSFEKSGTEYYIEPDESFRSVIKENNTGVYLYLFINSEQKMYLEFVNYTDGVQKLNIYKSLIEVDNQKFPYYLNWVKSNSKTAEYCSIETNTTNFLELFKAIAKHENEFKITFIGENGGRTQILPKEMAFEIKNILNVYHKLIN